MTEFEQLEEKRTHTQQVYDGCLLKVFKDKVLLPNGQEGIRELIRHKGAVCIVPLTEDNQVYVERQFRYPLYSVLTEIPAGKLDDINEDKLSAAKRELKEETGLSANRWTDLGDFVPTCAYSDEKIRIYLAQDLSEGERNLDEDEFLNVTKVSLDELVKQIMSGEIVDGKTQAALLKAYCYVNDKTGNSRV